MLRRSSTSSRVNRSFCFVSITFHLRGNTKGPLGSGMSRFLAGLREGKRQTAMQNAPCTFSARPYKEAKRLNSRGLQPVQVSTTGTPTFQRYCSSIPSHPSGCQPTCRQLSAGSLCARGVKVVRPLLHEPPAAVEQVRAGVGHNRTVPEVVGQRRFRNGPGGVCLLQRPCSE